MKRLAILFVLALAGCSVTVGPSGPVSHVSNYTTIRNMTYMLRMPTGTCSAVAVSENQVLTAKHCVENVEDPSVLLLQEGRDLIEARGISLLIDQNADLALITFDTKFKTWAKLAKSAPAVDSKVFVVGYPLGIAEFVTLGIVQAYTEEGMYASADAIFGNSGGPLFVIEDGEYVLAGITSFLATAWGAPITYIIGFIPFSSIDSFLDKSFGVTPE